MLSITGTDAWKQAFPEATIGLLEFSGAKSSPSSKLEDQKRAIETNLREQYKGYTRQDFLALPVMSAYYQYYKRFSKTYHVLLQVESIALKGKNLPNVSPLVDANFMAEVETLVLTAGHDAAKLHGPVIIDVSMEGDSMMLMNGSSKEIYAGDMVMKDMEGICCSIIYGQDNHSPISTNTSHALYVSYAPAGVPAELIETHLRKIESNVRLFSPDVAVEQLRLLKANTV